MQKARDHFMDWLRDAHGMERQAENLFKAQADEIGTFVAVAPLLAEARVRSERQREALEKILSGYGTSHSGIKETVGQIVSFAQNISGMFVADEPVKSILALSTFAQMKVASYTILAAAAQVLGDEDNANTLRAFADEETEFSENLMSQLGPVTEAFLQRSAKGGGATPI